MTLEEIRLVCDCALTTIQPEKFWIQVRHLIIVAQAAKEVNRQARMNVPGGPSFLVLNEALRDLEEG